MVTRTGLGALLLVFLLAGCREETHETRRLRMWQEDSKACNKFAVRRKEARELLAYDPELTGEKRRADSERRFSTFDQRTDQVLRLLNEDRRKCLRGQGWKDEYITELEERDRAENAKR